MEEQLPQCALKCDIVKCNYDDDLIDVCIQFEANGLKVKINHADMDCIKLDQYINLKNVIINNEKASIGIDGNDSWYIMIDNNKYIMQYSAGGGDACYDILFEGSAMDFLPIVNKIIDFMENKSLN